MPIVLLNVLREDKLDENGKEFLNRIRAGSQRMGHLINDILKLSKISRSELNFREFSLSDVVKSITEFLSNSEPERQAEFVIDPSVSIRGDIDLFRIAMENLLGNAWKFSSKEKHAIIEFGKTKVNGELAYFVKDNGAGFNPDYVAKLFTAFQRLHGNDEFQGTGIGLATVKRVINRHAGKIWAESAEGEGAVFYFTIEEH